jgi:hypothetical protein
VVNTPQGFGANNALPNALGAASATLGGSIQSGLLNYQNQQQFDAMMANRPAVTPP